MNLLHAREKEQFKKLFSQERVENFDNRLKVLEAFLSIEGHANIGGANWVMRKLAHRSPLVEPMMTTAMTMMSIC